MLTRSNCIFFNLFPPNDNATPGELYEFLSSFINLGLFNNFSAFISYRLFTLT